MGNLGIMVKQIRVKGVAEIYIRDIDFSAAEDSEIKEFAILIREMPTLSSVTLQNVNLVSVSPENLRLIFEAIASRKELLDVWLPVNNLGSSPEKFLLIVKQLAEASLNELNLSDNSLEFLKETDLEKLLALKPLRLRRINLSENQLGKLVDKGLLMFGKYLMLCQGITNLQLHSDSLGLNPFVCEFLEQLQQLQITELNFANNELYELTNPDRATKVDIKRAIELLARHSTLQKLSLANNLLCAWDVENLSSFFRIVSQNNSLKQLDLRANQFGDLSEYQHWDVFLDNFAGFIAAAPFFGLEVIYDHCNFDGVNRAVLMKEIDQHGSLMSQTFFYGNKRSVNLQAIIAKVADKVAKEMIGVLQASESTDLFNQGEEFEKFLHKLDKAVISRIIEQRKSTAPEKEGTGSTTCAF